MRTVLAGLLVVGVNLASGQTYPSKVIHIVTSGAGGGTDFASRFIAQGLSGPLHEQVIVDNRSPTVAPVEVAKAEPDGYTLLVAAEAFWIAPLLGETPYDPVKDFSSVSLLSTAPNLLIVNTSLPVKSVKDLIALAKAKPGGLNYAAVATGGVSYLAAELFKSQAGVNIVYVPYKSSALANADLVSGRVQMTFAGAAAAAPLLQDQRLKAIAVSSTKPTALAPGLPTISASGLPGYEMEQLIGMFGPAKVPAPIITRLNSEIARVLKTEDAKEKFFKLGVEPATSTPQEFAVMVKEDIDKLGKVIKAAGIKAD